MASQRGKTQKRTKIVQPPGSTRPPRRRCCFENSSGFSIQIIVQVVNCTKRRFSTGNTHVFLFTLIVKNELLAALYKDTEFPNAPNMVLSTFPSHIHKTKGCPLLFANYDLFRRFSDKTMRDEALLSTYLSNLFTASIYLSIDMTSLQSVYVFV